MPTTGISPSAGGALAPEPSPESLRPVRFRLFQNGRRRSAMRPGVEIAALGGRQNWVNSAVFCWIRARVVTSSNDKTARIWDTATGAEIAVLSGHEDKVHSAAFSPDGAWVVTASDDTTARVWDAATGAEIAVLSGHEDRVQSAAFSPDGAWVVTASDDTSAGLGYRDRD